MAALTADTTRKYEDGIYGDLPVKASSTIYRGDAVGLTAGYARQLVAGDLFGGFASAKAVGTSANGGVNVNVIREGFIELAVTSAAVTDIGKGVWASDSNTFSLTPSTGTRIGVVARYVSSGVCLVKFIAQRASGGGGIIALTDSSGGAAANDTIGAVTAPTALTDNGGGTADATVASQAAPTTLTDSTGQSGTHDDTLAATTTMADITGGESPTEAEFNTLLAEVRVICQNASDSGQKIIELVTLAGTAQNNLKELTTAQAANRLAIVALTDAITEVATKVNEILNNLE